MFDPVFIFKYNVFLFTIFIFILGTKLENYLCNLLVVLVERELSLLCLSRL